MHVGLKKTFLVALSLGGFLMLPPLVSAHENVNSSYYSNQSQSGVYRWPRQEQVGFYNDYRSGAYYGHPWHRRHRGWCKERPHRWYGRPRYYDNSNYQRSGRYYPPRYYGHSYSNQYPGWR